MTDLNQILHIGKSSLLSHQRAIQTTSHNIANANTPGYTRQRVNLATLPPVLTAAGMSGTGVGVESTERIFDRYLDAQIVAQKSDLGSWEAISQTLAQVEGIFNEITGGGISSALSQFWGAWNDLANNPSGPAERQALISQSTILAANFNQTADQLNQIESDLTSQINLAVTDINGLTERIADLNDKIFRVELTGQNANDFRDERQLLLNELSNQIPVEVTEDGSHIQVTLAGESLVVRDQSYALRFTDPDFEVDTAGGGTAAIAAAAVDGGRVGGWLATRNTILPQYQTQLDDLAAGLIAAVNTQHAAGYGLGDAVGGRNFFAGTGAADLDLDPAIAADPNLIAAAGDPGGLAGDNQNALAIADLKFALTLNGGTETFDEFYQSLVVQVGSDAGQAASRFDSETALQNHLLNRRDAISGVSIDEETVNLLKFEQAYQAAARVITTADEMYETLLGMI